MNGEKRQSSTSAIALSLSKRDPYYASWTRPIWLFLAPPDHRCPTSPRHGYWYGVKTSHEGPCTKSTAPQGHGDGVWSVNVHCQRTLCVLCDITRLSLAGRRGMSWLHQPLRSPVARLASRYWAPAARDHCLGPLWLCYECVDKHALDGALVLFPTPASIAAASVSLRSKASSEAVDTLRVAMGCYGLPWE